MNIRKYLQLEDRQVHTGIVDKIPLFQAARNMGVRGNDTVELHHMQIQLPDPNVTSWHKEQEREKKISSLPTRPWPPYTREKRP